jgi:hypothetical protein
LASVHEYLGLDTQSFQVEQSHHFLQKSTSFCLQAKVSLRNLNDYRNHGFLSHQRAAGKSNRCYIEQYFPKITSRHWPQSTHESNHYANDSKKYYPDVHFPELVLSNLV